MKLAQKITWLLIGAGLASSWWSMTVVGSSEKFLIPTAATIFFLVGVSFQLTMHWDD